MLTGEDRESLSPEQRAGLEVERLSVIAVKAMSDRDWDFEQTPEARELRQHHIAAEWSADFDSYPEPLDFQGQVDAHRKLFESNPNAYYEVADISSRVEDDLRYARVCLQIKMGGLGDSGGASVCGFAEFRWRCSSEGRWLWFRHVAMRGFDCVGMPD